MSSAVPVSPNTVKHATAAYRQPRICEVKNQRRCNDLVLQIGQLSREAGRYSDEAGRLQRDVDLLRREAARDFTYAALAALSGLSVALLRMKRILAVIRRFKKGEYSRQDLVELLSLVGPLASAASAFLAATKLAEAQSLAREAEDLASRAEGVGESLLRAVDEYNQTGCCDEGRFTGS